MKDEVNFEISVEKIEDIEIPEYGSKTFCGIVMIVIGIDLIKAGCGSGSEWLARHSIIM